MRTLTAYGIGVIIVLALLNTIAWQGGMPRLHSVNVFLPGLSLGCSVRPLRLGFTGIAAPPDSIGSLLEQIALDYPELATAFRGLAHIGINFETLLFGVAAPEAIKIARLVSRLVEIGLRQRHRRRTTGQAGRVRWFRI